MKISAILITRNEAAMIGRALKSVAWADEIIVVDSGSTDNTVELCRQAGAKVLVTADWPGFGPQKNRALALASGEWIFSLDADEWVTLDAQREIREAIVHANGKQAFRMPRRSSYCGHFMRHGGWWPDYVVRLFRRERGRFSEDLVHERLILDGPVGTLKAPLLHETYRDLDEVLAKINRYSTAGAQMAFAKGRRSSLAGAVAHGSWAFMRTYVLRLGLLDGAAGFMLAVSNAETVYYKYRKLALLARTAGRES